MNLTLVGLLPVQDLDHEYCYGGLGYWETTLLHSSYGLVPSPSLAIAIKTGDMGTRLQVKLPRDHSLVVRALAADPWLSLSGQGAWVQDLQFSMQEGPCHQVLCFLM